MLVSQLAFFLERGRDDPFEPRGYERIQMRDRTRRAIENQVVNDRGRTPTECLAAGHHFIEHCAEREEIGS
jgi:hypothetical protein